MEKDKLLIISLDALSADDLSLLSKCPAFSSLAEGGTLVRDTETIYLSNTYPIHTSVVTGCQPFKHGIFDNTLPRPGDSRPPWHWYAREIKVPTIYGKAAQRGYTIASILWPVSAGARIRYNIPEILPIKPWQNQVMISLLNGSPLLQLRAVLKFGRKLSGAAQPQLDDFSCNVLCDLIQRKKPDLMMIHLTDVDTHKHRFGTLSPEVSSAIERLDQRLSKLIAALETAGIRDRCHIVVFSDHGMTDVLKSVNPNKILADAGLLHYRSNGSMANWKAWIKCSGGSGFLYLKDPNDIASLTKARSAIQDNIASSDGYIKGFIDPDQFMLSGMDQESFLGIEPRDAYEFVEHEKKSHKANHGYPIQSGKYNTFYLLQGPRIKKNLVIDGGSLLDIAPLCAELLHLPKWPMDGILKTNYFNKEDDIHG